MKQIHGLMQTVALAIALGIPASCSATEPLHDILFIDGHDGPFFPEKCCWVDLPRTEKLIAARRQENCSAIGGPVGRFRIADGKVWLVGLRRCGGDMPLKEIFPELGNPAFAKWLNGAFRAEVNHMCLSPFSFGSLYRTTFRLEIKDGVVTDMQRQENDEADCRKSGTEPQGKTAIERKQN